MKTAISLVARNERRRHALPEESVHVLCEASELKSRIHDDVGLERGVDLKTSIIIFRKS